MNMGETEQAISQYLKAAKKAGDDMLSPIYYKKAGEAYLHIGNFDKALETFTMLKNDYLNSPEGQEADKFIKQAELQKESK
jgi:tetratricopeptide (TPR) repeat protein